MFLLQISHLGFEPSVTSLSPACFLLIDKITPVWVSWILDPSVNPPNLVWVDTIIIMYWYHEFFYLQIRAIKFPNTNLSTFHIILNLCLSY